jgi:hypothetical protein
VKPAKPAFMTRGDEMCVFQSHCSRDLLALDTCSTSYFPHMRRTSMKVSLRIKWSLNLPHVNLNSTPFNN